MRDLKTDDLKTPCKRCNNAHAQIQAVKSRSISLGVYYAYLTTRDYPNNLQTQRIFFFHSLQWKKHLSLWLMHANSTAAHLQCSNTSQQSRCITRGNQEEHQVTGVTNTGDSGTLTEPSFTKASRWMSFVNALPVKECRRP